jgi:general secretion pathway protein E
MMRNPAKPLKPEEELRAVFSQAREASGLPKKDAPAGNTRPKLGEILIEQGIISRDDLAAILSRQLGVPLVSLSNYEIQPEAVQLVPEAVARKYKVIPLTLNANSLDVAMVDTNDVLALEALSATTQKRIQPVIASGEDIDKAIERTYKSYDEIEKQFVAGAPGQAAAAKKALDNAVAGAPAVKALDLIIDEAVKNRASDIHIEPEENGLRLRYRIDGSMHEIMNLPLSAHQPIISRLKILAGMNIADRRPQDGQFTVKVHDREIDIRVATVSADYGEMATLRLLDKSFAVKSLSDIGFLPESLKQYREMLDHPYGMILISGPTGSGKTTTLYASIASFDCSERNIITIEDPIEYHLRGINQIQVNARAGLTFGTGIRSLMRHDPNIILVGEIRDAETASIAVQAALTGHLLLASIHANDALGVLYRLVDLGVEPFLVTSALVGVVAQRMVRRVCPHCKELRKATIEGEVAYEKELGEKRTEFYYGKGCNMCAGSGYLGRIAVFELLGISEEIRRMMLANANTDEIRKQAWKEGMTTMRHDAMRKVKEGITTPDEVLRRVSSLG